MFHAFEEDRMVMDRSLIILIAACVLAAGPCGALAQTGGKPDKRSTQPRQPAAQEEGFGSGSDSVAARQEGQASRSHASANPHKQALEAYLNQRLKSIKRAYQMQIDFMAKEDVFWQDFWKKNQMQRYDFEVQLARQRLNFFPSLSSLGSQYYDSTLANFRKMEDSMIKSFEQEQKQAMQEFFARRDARWKDFILRQEKDRADFVAGAEAYWQSQAAALRRAAAGGPSAPKEPARNSAFGGE